VLPHKVNHNITSCSRSRHLKWRHLKAQESSYGKYEIPNYVFVGLSVTTCDQSEDSIGTERMASSGMLRRVALVWNDASEELSASIIRAKRIGELGTTLAVTSSPILVTLMKEELSSSETSVLTRATLRNIPEDAIIHYRNCLPILFEATEGTWTIHLEPSVFFFMSNAYASFLHSSIFHCHLVIFLSSKETY
jgi:hypothetical protein